MAKVKAKTSGICSLMYGAKGCVPQLSGPYASADLAIDAAMDLLDDDSVGTIFMVHADHQVQELEDILTLIVIVGAQYDTGLDFYSVKVRCTVADQDAGRHYEAAIEYIKTKFTNPAPIGPFFVFDEHDAAFQHIDATDLCDSPDVIRVKRSQAKTPSKKGKR
jgi:hypothetical protein